MIRLLGQITPGALLIVGAGALAAWLCHALGELDAVGCDFWSEDEL